LLVLLLLLFVLRGVYVEIKLNRLKNSTDVVLLQVDALRSVLQIKRRETGLDQAQKLSKESAEMRQLMASQTALMQVIQKGEVGSLQGHSVVFNNLATVPQQGVWLQQIDVSNAGRSLALMGMAMQTESLMQYATAVSRSFQALNIEFASLELFKDSTADADGRVAPSVLKFKLN
jgi:hypothetical protein